MKEWFVRIGKVTYQAVLGVSALVALITFFFGDINEIKNFLEPYWDSIIGMVILILILVSLSALYGWLLGMLVRDMWRRIRRAIQKRRDRRQLRTIARNIAALKQFIYWRSTRFESSGGEYLDIVIRRQNEVRSMLAETSIPAPVQPADPNYAWELEKWAMYLDMLLSLSTVGDIDEARIVLSRIEEHDRRGGA